MAKVETVIIEQHENAVLIRMNRPQALNALNRQLLTELMDALEEADRDDAIGAMVITGNEKAFAAGADIKEMINASTPDMLNSEHISQFDRIRSIRKPIIAAVCGWCLGGGNEIALSCDLVIAGENAKFGQPEINLGVIPGAGGTQRLTRQVGKVIAMEMVLNNRTLSASEALQYGLVNRVTPIDKTVEEAITLARQIASRAPLAVRMGKQAVNHTFDSLLHDGLEYERRSFAILFSTRDQKEGMQAFEAKRPPLWSGS